MDEKRTTKDVGVIDACIKELASALVSACAERGFSFLPTSEWCIILLALLGCRQVVRHQVLVLTFGGSNPSIPTKACFVTPLYNL